MCLILFLLFLLMHSQLHRFIRKMLSITINYDYPMSDLARLPVYLPLHAYHPSIVVIFPCINSSCLESAKETFQFFCSFFFIGIGCEQLSGSPQIQMKKLTRDELLQVTML